MSKNSTMKKDKKKDLVEVVVDCYTVVRITAKVPRKKAMKIKSEWDPVIDEIVSGGYSADEVIGDLEAKSFYIREIPQRLIYGSKTP